MVRTTEDRHASGPPVVRTSLGGYALGVGPGFAAEWMSGTSRGPTCFYTFGVGLGFARNNRSKRYKA
jgi:hypothetical protein